MGQSFAQTVAPAPVEEKAPVEKEEKVQTGVVASSGSSGKNNINVNSTDSPGDVESVVTASISRVKKSECKVVLVNNGKKGYSVSFNVEGINERGNKELSKSFSASIAAGEKVEKSVSNCKEGLNLAVNLRSARALNK